MWNQIKKTMKAQSSTQYVSYLRMSKLNNNKTIADSYGIEAQRQDIKRYLSHIGGVIVQEYVEVETGTRKKVRIEIQKAIDLCKQTGATLLIAKLDRLSRDVAFTANLMNSGVNFICVDNPNATRLTIHILAAVAEDEARRISDRVKKSLAIAKSKGVLLGADQPGSKPWNNAARQASIATRKELALINPNSKRAAGYVCTLRTTGLTFQEISDKLNKEGFVTARNKAFTPMAAYLLHQKFC